MNWIQLLESHHIAFDTRGKNVSGNHIAIQCPWCGSTDPSRHLVISLDGAGWHCWRRKDHRGKSAVRLIMALLHCSVEQARTLAGERNPILAENMTERIRQMLNPKTIVKQLLSMPAEFRSFRGQYSSKRFTQYLRGRYFPAPIEQLTKDYDMYYAVTGEFYGRILFMIRSPSGELMAWTGRSVYPNEKLRYKTEGPAGDYLLWLDRLPRTGSRTLVLCEGPMDALKVNVFGHDLGIDATCCFTSAPTRRQIDRLYQLRPRYQSVYVMLDGGEIANTLGTMNALEPLGVKPIWLPQGLKDPGEMRSQTQLVEIMALARNKLGLASLGEVV